MSPLTFVEKLPAWVHLATLVVAILYIGLTALAHVPWLSRYPKLKLFLTRAGSWFGNLRKDLHTIDAALHPPASSPPSPPKPPSQDNPKRPS